MTRLVEICVESASGALAAELGGADRVELCHDRAVGGVTPSAEVVEAALRAVAIPLHVLIRPRAGDFFYQKSEIARMLDDIAVARELGAAGVVLGALDQAGGVDRKTTLLLASRARPMSVTFHKAFDAVRDPYDALDDLSSLRIDRVLTSGHAPTARDGLEMLSELVKYASGRITILAGGGLTPDDLPSLKASGVCEIHAASCVLDESGGTCPARVRRLVNAWRDD
jgi:copper homeostasis protein